MPHGIHLPVFLNKPETTPILYLFHAFLDS
jgi:hypothetical protein